MAEKKQCRYCQKPLAKLNKSGHCADCFKNNVEGIHSEYLRKRRTGSSERPVCKFEDCGKKLRADNEHGYCSSCFYSNRDGCRTEVERTKRTGSEEWKEKLCENPECKAVLMSNNTRGICSPCYNANYNHVKTRHEKAKTLGYLPDKLKICKADGCKTVLQENNERGYCKSCWSKNTDGARSSYTNLIYTGVVERESCKGCDSKVPLHNKSGYCSGCYSKNVDGIRTAYDTSIKRRMQKWTLEGIKFTEQDVQDYIDATNCEMCGIEFGKSSNQKKNLDHCHDTGEVRGILCGKCNRSIGLLGDNLPKILERVFQYYSSYAHRQGKQIEVNLNR